MNSRDSASAKRNRLLLPLGLLAVALAALVALWFLKPDPAPQGNLSGSSVGGPFTLVDEDGRTVTNESFAGKWRLMYFGFTFCPDVCPTDTAKLAEGLKAFEAAHPDKAALVQPIFVTVDPERDSKEALKEFTDTFHPRLLGLTGTRAQIDAVLKSFRVYASKVPGVTPGSYTFDHLAIIYLMDPQGRPVQFIAGATATPQQITEMLERFLA
ncbi:SCO family protein [Sandaracinobacteroides hominis]|uniref:SCO family protein n=1 Tax=Sandaracinobacteroides hominis TaxID=2780086 RepID=UPI0018F6CC2A|nr:SCO family protein [Sandaracinobacteroides hominis]